MSAQHDRRGFALITVLWALVFLGALAVEFHMTGQADRAVTSNLRSTARARWAAHAGLARSLATLERALASDSAARLLSTPDERILPTLQLRRDRVLVWIDVRDARARVQINATGPQELERLLEAVGMPPEAAEATARRIVNWRERHAAPPGSALQPPGSLSAQGYQAVPETFSIVDDLRSVPGLPAEVYRAIAPLLSVAGDGRVNVNSASAPVLRTLYGVDPVAAAAILDRRRQRPFTNVFDLLSSLPDATRAGIEANPAPFMDRVAFGPREVEVTVAAMPDGSPIVGRLHATVLLVGGSKLSLQRIVER